MWYDKKRKWFCLGSHFGKIDDGYITGTGFMRKAYEKRPQDFKRRILQYLNDGTPRDLQVMEQQWLDLIKEAELCQTRNRNVRYYNQKRTATGGHGPTTEQTKEKQRQSMLGKLAGRKQTPSHIENNRLARIGKKRGPYQVRIPFDQRKPHPRIYTAEHRQKLSVAAKGRKLTPEQCERRRQNALKQWERKRQQQ